MPIEKWVSASVSGSGTFNASGDFSLTAGADHLGAAIGLAFVEYDATTVLDDLVFAGTSATFLVAQNRGTTRRVEVWYLTDPIGSGKGRSISAQGPVGLSGTDVVMGVTFWVGVDTTTPFISGHTASAEGDTTTPTVDCTTAAGEMVLDGVVDNGQVLTVDGSQTEEWNLAQGGIDGGGSFEEATGATTTMSWTTPANSAWAICAVSMNPRAGPSIPDRAMTDLGSNRTTHTVTLPGNIKDGDLLMVGFTVDDVPTVTFPTGWDLVKEIDTAGSEARLSIYKRDADGTEGSTIDITTSTSQASNTWAIRIIGQSTTTDPVASTGATGTSVNPNSDSLSPAGGADDYMWISTFGCDASSVVLLFGDWPTNYTRGRLSDGGLSADGVSMAEVGRFLNAATEDPGQYTMSNSQPWVAVTLAVYPAAGGAAEKTKTYLVDALLQALGRTQGYTADALLQTTGIQAAYTIDAFLQKQKSEAYTADAVLKALGVQRTFTADVLLKVLGQSQAYTLDALLQTTGVSETYTLDTFLQAQKTETYLADVVLKALGTAQAYSIDAVLKALGVPGTYTLDALLQETGVESTYSLDAFLQAQKTAAYTLDAFLQAGKTEGYTADAILKALDQAETYLIDVILSAGAISKTYEIDAILKALGQAKTYLADALLQETDKSRAYSLDSFLQAERSQTYLADLLLKALGVQASYTLDSLLQETGVAQSYTADAFLQAQQSQAYTADAMLAALGVQRTYLIDVVLATGAGTRNYTVDAILKALGQQRAYSADALLQSVDNSAGYVADALLQKPQSLAYTTDAILKALAQARTYLVDVVLSSGEQSQTYQIDALLQVLGAVRAYTSDVLLQIERSQAYTVDSLLQAEASQTYSLDSFLQAEQSRTYLLDALLQSPESRTYLIDLILELGFTVKAYLADVVLKALGQQSAYLVDLVLSTIVPPAFNSTLRLQEKGIETFSEPGNGVDLQPLAMPARKGARVREVPAGDASIVHQLGENPRSVGAECVFIGDWDDKRTKEAALEGLLGETVTVSFFLFGTVEESFDAVLEDYSMAQRPGEHNVFDVRLTLREV